MRELTEAQNRAMKWLLKQGGIGVINRYGRVIAGGETSPSTPETWLRLITMEHVAPDGYNRLKINGGAWE